MSGTVDVIVVAPQQPVVIDSTITEGAVTVAGSIIRQVDVVVVTGGNPIQPVAINGTVKIEPVLVNAWMGGMPGPEGPQGPPGASYTLPIASETVLGGVKVDGSTINITSTGIISSTSGIPEAPLDHQSWGRMDASWTRVIASTGDIVDGGSF